MAGYTGISDEDQVNSGGLLGPELTTQVGIKGRQAGDDITSKFLNFAAGAEGTPPERITPGPIDAPEIKPANRITLPGRESIGGYPIQPEHRTMAGESSIGPEYTGDQQAIPERNAPATPSDQISKAELSGGRTQYNTPEGPVIAGPERFFRGGREVDAGTKGAESGDELARRRMESESNAQYGIPEKGRSILRAGGQEVEMAGGRTLAEKEAAEGGPGGGEFDFGSYKKAIAGIGGKVGLKTRLAILGHMMGEHEKKAEFQRKLKELDITHGPESPYAKNIQSEIQHRAAQTQNLIEMAPIERQKSIEEIAHIKARTEAIPYEVALHKSTIEYHKSLIDMKEFSNESAYLKILTEQEEKALPNSPEAQKAQRQIDEIVNYRRGQANLERYLSKHPEDRGKVTWKDDRLVEIK